MSSQSPILLRNLTSIALGMVGILVLYSGFPAVGLASVWFSGIVFYSGLVRLSERLD